MSKQYFDIDDARRAAKRRMPNIMFNFVDGGAGSERGLQLNSSAIDDIRLQPRVLVNIENRSLKKTFLGREWGLPFGIAPMGMCDLAWPRADVFLASAAVQHNVPLGIATMASSSIETTRQRAGENAWFQLYVGQSEALAFDMVDRVEKAGYETLVLTVDVPLNAIRPREQRSGFRAPLKINLRQFIDFALHPQWSLTTLAVGVPKVANNTGGSAEKKFERGESRGRVDRAFLKKLRDRWKGNLIVKGVLSTVDAAMIRKTGADAIWVSNHGGRQLDSSPAAIHMLPRIRACLGPEYPLIFDSGVRNGEAIIKALALGADFVMLGRPFLYGVGGGGESGLNAVFELLIKQVDTTLAQLGCTDVSNIDRDVLVSDEFEKHVLEQCK